MEKQERELIAKELYIEGMDFFYEFITDESFKRTALEIDRHALIKKISGLVARNEYNKLLKTNQNNNV